MAAPTSKQKQLLHLYFQQPACRLRNWLNSTGARRILRWQDEFADRPILEVILPWREYRPELLGRLEHFVRRNTSLQY